MFLSEIRQELENHIIPFWKGLKDVVHGGYYGFLDYDLRLDREAIKGVILHSRILWFFSNAYELTNDADCLTHAHHAYEFIKESCIDPINGGVYWSLTYEGKPEDTTKHTYNQAFSIYALSSYYSITKKEEALALAYELFDIVEQKCCDELGYLEAFDKEFQPVDNDKLSENGLLAHRTMNTLLHVFEAYTELYRVDHNEKVGARLKWMLDQFAHDVYNPTRNILEVFFDSNMKTISDLHSYGHDIEAAWLIDLGCEVLGDPEYSQKMNKITTALTENIYHVAYDGVSLNNECFHGEVDTTKIWWVEAEAMVGFVNGYQKDHSKTKYLEATKSIWDFIKKNMIDPRQGSEWFYDLNKEGIPESKKEIVGPWKCPYHNGRMCFQMLKRGIELY